MKKIGNFFRLLAMDLGRLVSVIFVIAFRIRKLDTQGRPCRYRPRGGKLLAANHTNFIDPLVVSSTFWHRRVFYLTAEVVMKNKILSVLLKGMGCIKIDRNISDIEAVGKAVTVLKKGRCLAMFPQGGIDRSDALAQVKAGAALIALQAGVSILPMYSAPRRHWWHRRVVVIGEELNPKDFLTRRIPSVEDIERISAELLERLEQCKNTYEGVSK